MIIKAATGDDHLTPDGNEQLSDYDHQNLRPVFADSYRRESVHQHRPATSRNSVDIRERLLQSQQTLYSNQPSGKSKLNVLVMSQFEQITGSVLMYLQPVLTIHVQVERRYNTVLFLAAQ